MKAPLASVRPEMSPLEGWPEMPDYTDADNIFNKKVYGSKQ
jgi:hypothetical protein